ncbi:metallophosphoesterase [Psychrobacillus sp. BL-248-WT-3]|uniref:metallophosphoesterase family protein n=1 Tax=Psychrobacillus sp. BL-248-WT-3 TaxID=2725306 RepID=UPI00146BB0FA|nr:metallophosphoesterase [Psychrobacillus sp. BL-248-WT-3]NME06137.1 hypothetical protein [Psychrobacillus sp. BL-248-WT-3]
MNEHKKLILDDFNNANLSDYETNHSFVSSYYLSLNKDYVKHGKYSLEVSFNYGGWVKGNGAMYIKFKKKLVTQQMPKKLAVWVHSDGKTPWLRATIIDGDNERKIINLTNQNISWNGWKYLDVELEQNWKLPLRLEQIYAVETNLVNQKDSSINGKFYLDHITFVYVDDQDLTGPIFSDILPQKEKIYRNSFVFSAVVSDDMSGVDFDSLIMKINNKLVVPSVRANKIYYHVKELQEGNCKVSIQVKDLAGNWSVPHLEKNYLIDLSEDHECPIISDVTPSDTAVIHTATPRIGFRLCDEHSGIEKNDIILTINNEKQKVFYDEENGWGFAISSTHLIDGPHHLSIHTKDRAGNEMDPYQQNFVVHSIKGPIDEDNFIVGIIPDTHTLEHGKAALVHLLEEAPEFIIHMGDFVDQGTEEEFKLAKTSLFSDMKKHIPILTLAGNHEAFRGNLTLYQSIMGSPSYHFTYGKVLFILLNSALGQSLTLSDSTQLTYLKEVLSTHEQKHIVVLTHVPTKDHFGTAHEMVYEDSVQLVEILTEHKKELPSRDIVVLFGHLHTQDQWEVSGVRYIITGNASPKKYVMKQENNIGYGLLHIQSNGIYYEYKPFNLIPPVTQ